MYPPTLYTQWLWSQILPVVHTPLNPLWTSPASYTHNHLRTDWHISGEIISPNWPYWQRGYLQYISLAVANSSLPYATLSIMRDHPHTASYHCRVYKVDCNFYISLRYATPNSIATSVLCVGLLSPIGPTTVQYSTSDTVILRVNITPTATFTYLWALTWYYNEVAPGPVTMIITITIVPFHWVVATQHSK